MTDEEKDWQTNHGNFIEAFLLFLNKQTDQFVLKGGTALSLCYGLDRFSEDIDLDGRKQDIKEIVKRFCVNHGVNFRVAKDTATVKRCIIDYGNDVHPLKIEVSYRNKNLGLEEASKDSYVPVCQLSKGIYLFKQKFHFLIRLLKAIRRITDQDSFKGTGLK